MLLDPKNEFEREDVTLIFKLKVIFLLRFLDKIETKKINLHLILLLIKKLINKKFIKVLANFLLMVF